MYTQNLQIREARYGSYTSTRAKGSGEELSLESDGQFDKGVTDKFLKQVHGDLDWIPGLKDQRLKNLMQKVSTLKGDSYARMTSKVKAQAAEALGPTWEARANWQGENASDRHIVVKASRKRPKSASEETNYSHQSFEISFPRQRKFEHPEVTLHGNSTKSTGGSHFQVTQDITARWNLAENQPINRTIRESASVVDYEV